ncbi:MAG: bifunctional helix-turn-helix transcriptional regulator/GNAT family N-acetyltransferase [Chloroflexota bacterium]
MSDGAVGQKRHGAGIEQRITVVRRFNRFYTPIIGLLHEGYLDSPFSLTQVRVLYELAHHDETTAAQLGRDLLLDPSYLSRMLRTFTELGMIDRRRSSADGRESILTLTDHGRSTFERLDQRSHDGIAARLAGLRVADQRLLVDAMASIERLLGEPSASRAPYLLRPPRAGDLGWVVQRHGTLYAQEYGWDETFEALVAEIVAGYGRHHDPRRERCWIAEVDGVNAGSVFCVTKSKRVAQLRLLLVAPEARGLGIGRRLVDECVTFAASVGYRKIMLWTNDVLVSARRIYEAAGFELVAEEPHHSFGHDLVGQSWERGL